MEALTRPMKLRGKFYVPADFENPTIQVASFRNQETEHFYRDKSLIPFAHAARRTRAHAMPFVQYSEQAILAGMFGNMAGAIKTAITAAATAQTSLATGNAAAWINGGRTGAVSGNMDQTPNTTAEIYVGTAGSTPNYNTYTAPHAFLLTNSAATALTIASQSIGLAISVGDFVFTRGSASAGGAAGGVSGPMWNLNALYIGLSTAAGTASQASLLSGEPTSVGAYQRIGYTGSTTGGVASIYGIPNNQVNFPEPTAASPSVLTSGAAFAFAASSAAWSTTSTNLTAMFFADALTLAGGNIVAAGALTTPQAVNAAGITLSFASTAITISLT